MPQPPLRWDGVDSQGNPLRWDSTPGLTWDGLVPEPPTTPQRMPQLRVLLGFTNMPDHTLDELAVEVSQKLYGNLLYDNPAATPPLVPPVTKAVLDAAQDAFHKAIAKAAAGGPQDTADKHNKRDTLIGLLRQLAGHVQAHHGNNLASLLSSGFDAVSTSTASHPLPKPAITDILNGNSGQLILRVGTVANTKLYEVRHRLIGPDGTPGPVQSGGLFSNSRSMPVNNLTPGGLYQFEVRCVGGSTGYSDWSDSRNHRSL